MEDCLEKGRDVCQGGARYPSCFTMNGLGFGTAIDSLAAIKTFVYDRREYSLQQVKEMLDSDFAGREAARVGIRRSTLPPTATTSTRWMPLPAASTTRSPTPSSGHRSPNGAFFLPQMFSYNSHMSRGETTAATPTGAGAGRRSATARGLRRAGT